MSEPLAKLTSDKNWAELQAALAKRLIEVSAHALYVPGVRGAEDRPEPKRRRRV